MNLDQQLRLATSAVVLVLVGGLLVDAGGAMRHAFSYLALAGVGLAVFALDAIAFQLGAVRWDDEDIARMPYVVAGAYGGFLLLFAAFAGLRLAGMPATAALLFNVAGAVLLAVVVLLALWLLIDRERRRP